MIGLSAAFGELKPDRDYLKIFDKIHQVEGLKMFSYKYNDHILAAALIMREELSKEEMNSCYWEDEKYVVIIDGYTCINDNNNCAEVVLRGWLSEEANFVKDLNGEYNILIYSKINNELFLFNDRFASRKLFYTKRSNSFFFASEKKAIFAAISEKPMLDNYGLMELFALSHNLGDTTIFQDIKVFLPASILSVKQGNLIVKKYWELNFRNGSGKLKPNELVQQMAVTLRDAAEKKYRGRNKLGLALSGGLDSRVVAATIPPDMRPFFARTYGEKDSNEVQVAKNIAGCLNFNHVTHAPRQIELSRIIYPIVWRSESYIPFINLLSIVTHFELKDKMWYNLGGHLGDALTGKHLEPFMFFPYSRNEFIKKTFELYISHTYKNEQHLKRIFNPIYFDQNYNAVKDTFYKSFISINSEKNPDQYNIWDLINRQARFTLSSSAVDNYIFQKILLFTDYDFVDIMLGIKPGLRFGQILYKKMIETQFDKIRGIPNSHTGAPIKSDIFSTLKEMGHRSYKKRMRRRRIYPEGGPGKANLIRKDRELHKMLMTFVSDSSFPADIFSKAGIIETLEEHYSGKKDLDYLLAALLTFVALFNLFILNNFTCMPEYAHPFRFSNKI